MFIEITLIEIADDSSDDKKAVEISVRGKLAQSRPVAGRRARIDETFRFPAIWVDGEKCTRAVLRVVSALTMVELGNFELGLGGLFASPGVSKQSWFHYSQTGSVHLRARMDYGEGERERRAPVAERFPATPVLDGRASARLSSRLSSARTSAAGGPSQGRRPWPDAEDGPDEIDLDFSRSFLSSIDKIFSFDGEDFAAAGRPERDARGPTPRDRERERPRSARPTPSSHAHSHLPEDACVELDCGAFGVLTCLCVSKDSVAAAAGGRGTGLPRR